MSRKEHENVSDFADSIVGSRTHKVADGTYTGYGSSRSLAEAAYEEAKKTNREYVQYSVDPKDDGILVSWNDYGPTRKEDEISKTETPLIDKINQTDIVRSGGGVVGEEPRSHSGGGGGVDLSPDAYKWFVGIVGF